MAIVQISKIQQRSGNLIDLPQLDEAEFGFASDEKRLFIGKTTENVENIEVLTSYSDIDFDQINGAVGNLDISALTVANGQVLTYDGNNWVNRGGNAGGLITLGTVSNVKITGGAIDYVLTTDGTGNLNWTPKSSIIGYIETAYPQVLSKNSTNATATDSVTDLVTLDDITGYQVNTCVVFSGTAFGNITADGSTYYYITSVDLGLGAISISETQGGANLALTTDTGSMTVNVVGTVVRTTDDNFLTDGLTATITNAKGMTELDGGSYYIDVLTANTFALYTDPLFAGSIDSTLYNAYAYTSVTATSASTNYVTVGDTTSFNNLDPVIFLGSTFGGIVANQTYYIANIASSTQFTLSTTDDGGNIVTLTTDSGTANVYVPGGRVIATISGGSGVSTAGGTQYSIQYNNTNLLDGDANFTYNFNTKLLTLAGGNANIGNLHATGTVTATRLISNVATGVATPIVVTSTDRVANLNVSYANVSDFGVVTQRTTGTFYPVFINGSSNGNYGLSVNSAFSFNAATGGFTTPLLFVNSTANVGTLNATGNVNSGNASLGNLATANFVSGTLTTASQPNITSFGNGTIITANGTLSPSSNVTYNLGNNTNRWNALYLSGSTIYLGNATISSSASGVVITNANGGTFTVSGTDAANSAAIVNGNSNVIVSANSNVNISVAGVANVLRVTSTGSNITGTLNATGNANVGNLGATSGVLTGTLNVTGNANVGNLGATSGVLTGTLSVTGNANVGNIGATSGVLTGTLGVTGNANVGNIGATSGVLTGTLSVTGNANVGNIGATSGVLTGTLSVTGNANVGNIGATTAVVTTGNITTINSGLLQNGNSNITITANSNVSIFVNGNATARAVFTSTGANIAGTANITGNANVGNIGATSGVLTGTLSVTGNANVGNIGTAQVVATGNISATQFISNITTGSAPLIVTSTTKVANLSVETANTATSATTAGTVTTNAQPNITSVSTSFTSLTFANAQTISGNNLTLTTGANTNSGTITGNWTLSSGSRLQATYADLAEYYTSDANYEPGTVLEFGGEEEVTIAEDGTNRIAGVVSTNPAYVMNSSCEGKHIVAIALQGRVPCKVRGSIKKGDMLISGGNGFARPTSHPLIGTIIGKALQNFDGAEGVIEVAVGRL